MYRYDIIKLLFKKNVGIVDMQLIYSKNAYICNKSFCNKSFKSGQKFL